MTIEKKYLYVIQERFISVKKLGTKALEQLSEGEIHWSLNEESNSIAVIVKHVSGNMVSRWTDFLHSDGEKPDRNRDQEFIDTISSKQELMEVWEKGWCILLDTLSKLDEKDLLQEIYIRGEAHSVIEAIERQMAHYAYHVGQIVFIAKQIKNNAWISLSIPRGKSTDFLQEMLLKHNSQEKRET